MAFKSLGTLVAFHSPPAKGSSVCILEIAINRPTDFNTQASQLQTELNELYTHELDLDNTDPYPGIGNDKKGVQTRISELEGQLELRINQENLLYSMSKKDLIKSVDAFRFQRGHVDLPSADKLKQSSKTDLVVLLTEQMGETYQDIRDSVGLDDWL